jgi:hypothetical protein
MTARWTLEEQACLKRFYPKYGSLFCSKLLGKSTHAIRTKASRLKINAPLFYQKDDSSYREFLDNSDYIVLEDYKGSAVKILHKHIHCEYEWKVSPNNLQKLVGCPNCSKTGSIKNKTTILYFIRFPTLDLYKIGITTDIYKRICSFKYKAEVLDTIIFPTGQQAYEEEQRIKKELILYSYNSGKLPSGNTETFKGPIEQLWQMTSKGIV